MTERRARLSFSSLGVQAASLHERFLLETASYQAGQPIRQKLLLDRLRKLSHQGDRFQVEISAVFIKHSFEIKSPKVFMRLKRTRHKMAWVQLLIVGLLTDDFVETFNDTNQVFRCDTRQTFPNSFNGKRANLANFHP